jgi:4-hydroxy-3-polyprenylbenzoate decarboxylase
MENAAKIWNELGLPHLRPESPWFGYSLGDWAPEWDVYAADATNGNWEKSGANTYARRRAGLTPETPVRSIEGGDKK